MRRRVLSLRNISFSTEVDSILSNISFDLYQGEILGIVGINGAGKTLLAKIISGLEIPDTGSIYLEDRIIQQHELGEETIMGIGYVGENAEILPNLTVAENLFLGINERYGTFFQRTKLNRMAAAVFAEYNFELDPSMPAIKLNSVQSIQLRIARLLLRRLKIIVLDDFSKVFSENEYKNLRVILNEYVENGGTLICFSHNYSDIIKLANRIIVMRNNTIILEIDNEEFDKNLLKRAMYDAESVSVHSKSYLCEENDQEEVLRLEQVSVGSIKKLSFSLMHNEVLGIIGINKCGKTDIIQGISGVLPIVEGSIWLEGKRVLIGSPRAAIKNGILSCYESHVDMLFMGNNSIRLNVTANILDRVSKGLFVSRRRENIVADEYCKLLGVNNAINQPMKELNNAKLLKVALARCLAANPKVLLLDEPNKELDRKGIQELCAAIEEVKRKTSIIIALSKVDDLANICDRVLIMHGGMFVASFDKGMLDYDMLMNVILSRGEKNNA